MDFHRPFRLACVGAWLVVAILSFPCVAAGQAASKKQAPARANRTEDARKLLSAAQESLEQKNFAVAASLLERYFKEFPDDAQVRVMYGYALIGLQRAKDAQREFARATELDPKLGPAFLNLGLSLLDENPKDAIPALSKSAELMPEEPRAHFALGRARERSGDTSGAAEAYGAAYKLDSSTPEYALAAARALVSLKRYADAELLLRGAIANAASHAEVRLMLIDALLAQQNPAAAIAELRALLAVRPDDAGNRLRLASLLAAEKLYADALRELSQIEAAGKTTPAGLRLAAEIHTKQGNPTLAVPALQRLVQLDDKDAHTLAWLGRLEMQRRNYAAARDALASAVKLKPDDTPVLKDFTAALYLNEQYAETLPLLDRLPASEKTSSWYWFVRATSCDKLGLKPEAIQAYEEFLRVDEGKSDKQSFQARHRIATLRRELQRKR